MRGRVEQAVGQHHGDNHGQGAGNDGGPARPLGTIARVLGRSQIDPPLRRQLDTLGREAGPGRAPEDPGLEEQHDRQDYGGQGRRRQQHHDRPDHRQDGEQRLDRGGPNGRPQPVATFFLLGRAQEGRLAAEQPAHDGQGIDPAQSEPDRERPQGVAPAAPLGSPQRPESAQHAGDQEGERHDEDRPGELADRQAVVQDGGDSGQEQEGGEANRQQVREPVNAPKQVGEPLADCQAKAMRANGNEVPPLTAQDLDPAECPSESLLLQTIKTQRHQAFPPDGRFVNANRPQAEHAKTGLRILRDDVLVPATDSLQRGSADQAHRPRENDGVAVRPARHRDIEEIAIAIEQASEIAAILPIAVVLWRLHECHALVGEVADHFLQEGRLDHVIGIDDAQDADVLRQPPRGLVERARLVAWPGVQVNELEAWAQLFAERLE